MEAKGSMSFDFKELVSNAGTHACIVTPNI